jgi:hypothetical protein
MTHPSSESDLHVRALRQLARADDCSENRPSYRHLVSHLRRLAFDVSQAYPEEWAAAATPAMNRAALTDLRIAEADRAFAERRQRHG